MAIDLSTNSKGVNTSENTITLVNGTVLTCYPKAVQPETIAADNWQLDTTGEYLSIGNHHQKKKQLSPDVEAMQRKKQEQEDLQFFLDHAFFFWQNAARIFKDSRLFLAPVPVQSGLAYTGTSGFHAPTLGIFIEWWLYSETNVRKDCDNNDILLYYIAGSPLSGANECRCVYPDGTVKPIHYKPFSSVWRSFVAINTRYTEAKQRYEAYSLQQVWDVLTAEEPSETSILATQLLIAEGDKSVLTKRLATLKQQYDDLYQKHQEVCVKLRQTELHNLAEEYNKRKQETNIQIQALQAQKKAYKAQLKQGLMDNRTYQKIIHPISKQCSSLEYDLSTYLNERINALLRHDDITYNMIMKVLSDYRVG